MATIAQPTSTTDQAITTDQATEATEPTTSTEPTNTDPTATLVDVLDRATDETDPITGTVPVMHTSLIVESLRAIRGNAKGETIASWSATAFVQGVASGRWTAQQVGAVLAIVANPPTPTREPVSEPPHVKLARSILVLRRAEEILIADESIEVRDAALVTLDDHTMVLTDDYVARAKLVAAEARKGKRGTGAKVNWADAILEAFASSERDSMSLAEVKSWAVSNLGASQGGAIDRRHAGLVEATSTSTAPAGQDLVLWNAGVRASVTDAGQAVFTMAPDDIDN